MIVGGYWGYGTKTPKASDLLGRPGGRGCPGMSPEYRARYLAVRWRLKYGLEHRTLMALLHVWVPEILTTRFPEILTT